jgi:hypothetical protein
VYFGGGTTKIHPYLPLTPAIPREPFIINYHLSGNISRIFSGVWIETKHIQPSYTSEALPGSVLLGKKNSQ